VKRLPAVQSVPANSLAAVPGVRGIKHAYSRHEIAERHALFLGAHLIGKTAELGARYGSRSGVNTSVSGEVSGTYGGGGDADDGIRTIHDARRTAFHHLDAAGTGET